MIIVAMTMEDSDWTMEESFIQANAASKNDERQKHN